MSTPDHTSFGQDPLRGMRPGGTHLRWSPDDEWHDGDDVDYDDDDDQCYCHVEEQPGAENPPETDAPRIQSEHLPWREWSWRFFHAALRMRLTRRQASC